VGAIFIEFVPNLADKVSKAAPGAVYGVILIAMLFLMPMGAGGFLASLWKKAFRSGADREQVHEPRQPSLGQAVEVGAGLGGSISRAEALRVRQKETGDT
jgi:hypothetical protein